MEELTPLFVRGAVRHLETECLARLERCLSTLSEGDLWWRPDGDATNAIGNLLLHLEGNVRQWILAGVGGARDTRKRKTEFAARDAAEPPFERLADTVRDACRVIESLDADALAQPRRIQGFETTTLEAVLHVVEHFSWHTGQIALITKVRARPGTAPHFYDDDALE